MPPRYKGGLCKRGLHRLSGHNVLKPEGRNRQCRKCFNRVSRDWKRADRRANGIGPRKRKVSCLRGHRYSADRRPGRYDCAACRRIDPALKRPPQTRAEYLLQKRKHQNNRRARQRDQFVESIDPTIVLARGNGRCGICQEPIDGAFEVDHIVPLARGGEHSYSNAQPAHPSCNRRKWALTDTTQAAA